MAYTTVGSKRPYTHRKPCPKCGKTIEYWWTSGMSECFPHFYCEDCGSPIWREQDRRALWNDRSLERLKRDVAKIFESLPPCHCGGRYTLDAGPRCPHCREEFPEELPFKERVYSPYITLLTGAKMRTED